eukprot:2431548-Heterocapsa_arctica.AAC.1
MVLFKETANETDTVDGIIEDLANTKARLRAIGQRLNDAKEHLLYLSSQWPRLSGKSSLITKGILDKQ